MTNLHAVKIFTQSLKELIEEKLTLYQSLKIIGQSKVTDKKIRNCAEYLASSVENGTLFSSAVRTCPFISFDNVYVSFISFSEKSGNLYETLDFLLARSMRKEENRNSLFSALVYPLFVVLLVLFISVLFFFTDGIIPGSISFLGTDKKEAAKTIFFCFMTFLFLGSAVIFLLLHFMGEDRLYEAFLAGGFLSCNGINMAQACNMASVVLGIDSKFGKVFQKAREGLEYGMDLRSAFSRGNDLKVQKKIELALLLAEETGNKDKVFLKIADSLKKENDRNRKYCLTLVEPAFIVLTGIFVMGIVINLVLPVVTDSVIM
ncbi:MAG: type II secretion system F family protein [Treponema sp.]|nr:type II secretion system F family protein [Treponema sp.]